VRARQAVRRRGRRGRAGGNLRTVPAETIAAVDVGTNSLHLIVARVTEGDRFEVVTREKEMVRLGAGVDGMKNLAPDALDRAVAALATFRRLADAHGADELRAVATSAVREAANRQRFLDRAQAEAGVEVEVISGAEEARLIHLGVLHGLDVWDRRLFLFDIGGGSTELLVGERDEVLDVTSVKLGAVRLTHRFFPGRSLHPSSVDSCRRHIRSTLAAFERPLRRRGFELAVGASGTTEQVLRLARGLAGEPPLRSPNGARLTRKQVRAVAAALVEARSAGTTAELIGLDPKREDIILAGALVLEGIVDTFGVKELTFSDQALREGVLLDTIQRERDGARLELRDVARRSALDLVNAWDPDPGHSAHVAHLALELFDATADRHGLGAEARALLEAGALLANVGLVIAHSQHHKHAYYLIRNCDRLVGFTDHEIELVAQIARYHRRSQPKASHPEWAALDPESQELVATAAGILRIAIGLDRSRAGLVKAVAVDDDGERLEIRPIPIDPDRDVELERWAVGQRVALLEGRLGLPITVAAP